MSFWGEPCGPGRNLEPTTGNVQGVYYFASLDEKFF
jgi:hypothetical protein